jgi:primosomal protein N' (replication factor Y)
VDVAFDIPYTGAFTYRVDAKNAARVGRRVVAPFGRRSAQGFVTAERAELPPGLDEAAVGYLMRTSLASRKSVPEIVNELIHEKMKEE